MWDFLAEAFGKADKIWYMASIGALWIGSAAFVFRHTKRALERRSSKVNARFEWDNKWQFSDDSGSFESTWEFSSPSLFIFLLGGPIVAPFAAYVYHVWGSRRWYARIRHIFWNCRSLQKAYAYRKRTAADDVLECDCTIEIIPDRDTMCVFLKCSNLGRYSVSIGGIKATLWADDNACVSSWTQSWDRTFHPNDTGVGIKLSLDSARTVFKRALTEWVYADAQLGTIVSEHRGSGIDYKFRVLPPDYMMRVEYVNARWM